MPSERTKELIAAVIDARIDYEKTPASRPVLVAQRRVKYEDADRALLSHYAEIQQELAAANEHREAVTEKLEAAQMHNYRQNERIAKMQAVVDGARTARMYGDFDELTAAMDALDALPSSTEEPLRPHRWEICSMCGPMVRCGNCGNNCCNGGSGDGCPDKCAAAYALQKLNNPPHDILAAVAAPREKKS